MFWTGLDVVTPPAGPPLVANSFILESIASSENIICDPSVLRTDEGVLISFLMTLDVVDASNSSDVVVVINSLSVVDDFVVVVVVVVVVGTAVVVVVVDWNASSMLTSLSLVLTPNISRIS